MSGSTHPDTLGLPIAPGTPFRYCSLDASWPTSAPSTTWVVCVLDHTAGPFIEARTHTSSRAVLITGRPGRFPGETDTSLVPAIYARLEAIPEDVTRPWGPHRWHDAIGAACSMEGCEHGLPMFDSAMLAQRSRGETECLAHRVRSVEACKLCGRPDLVRYIQRADLLRRGLCFGCALWEDRAEEVKGDPAVVITPEWKHYKIGPSRPGTSSDCKGFGGAKWVVTFTDGRVVHTDNLWLGGDIPEHLRPLFAVNATLASDR